MHGPGQSRQRFASHTVNGHAKLQKQTLDNLMLIEGVQSVSPLNAECVPDDMGIERMNG
jgi:hypothetical protein